MRSEGGMTRRYEVGEKDPTPDLHMVEMYCGKVCSPVGMCTWEPGHEGQCVAGTGKVIVGVSEDSR